MFLSMGAWEQGYFSRVLLRDYPESGLHEMKALLQHKTDSSAIIDDSSGEATIIINYDMVEPT